MPGKAAPGRSAERRAYGLGNPPRNSATATSTNNTNAASPRSTSRLRTGGRSAGIRPPRAARTKTPRDARRRDLQAALPQMLPRMLSGCIRPPNAQPSRVRAYITSASHPTWFGIRQRCTCYRLAWTPLSSPFGSVMRASRPLTDMSRRTLRCWRMRWASWPPQDLLRVASSRTTNSWRFWLPYDYGEPAEI